VIKNPILSGIKSLIFCRLNTRKNPENCSVLFVLPTSEVSDKVINTKMLSQKHCLLVMFILALFAIVSISAGTVPIKLQPEGKLERI
jgi:hypothetical protein